MEEKSKLSLERENMEGTLDSSIDVSNSKFITVPGSVVSIAIALSYVVFCFGKGIK